MAMAMATTGLKTSKTMPMATGIHNKSMPMATGTKTNRSMATATGTKTSKTMAMATGIKTSRTTGIKMVTTTQIRTATTGITPTLDGTIQTTKTEEDFSAAQLGTVSRMAAPTTVAIKETVEITMATGHSWPVICAVDHILSGTVGNCLTMPSFVLTIGSPVSTLVAQPIKEMK